MNPEYEFAAEDGYLSQSSWDGEVWREWALCPEGDMSGAPVIECVDNGVAWLDLPIFWSVV